MREFRKITFSQLTITKKLEKNCSVAEAEKWAYTADEYKTIIEGLLYAEKNILLLEESIVTCSHGWTYIVRG